jgi:hypothetical protein
LSESLAAATAAYAALTGLWAATRAIKAGGVGRGLAGALVVLELAAVGQAIAALLALLGGHDLGRPGALAGYMLLSVAILPAVWPLSRDDARWGPATLAVGVAAFAVVTLRAYEVWSA